MNKIVRKWKQVNEELAHAFVAEYFEDPEFWWVGDDIGGLLYVNNFFFTPERMIECFMYRATFEQINDYYNLELERDEDGRPLANFKNYLIYGFTWLDKKDEK